MCLIQLRGETGAERHDTGLWGGGVLSDPPLTSLALPVADPTPLSGKVLQFSRFGEEDQRAGEAAGSG